MMRLDDFMDVERLERKSSGVLYINIYPIAQYPKKIKILKVPHDESFSSSKWRKRIGNFVYYYGKGVENDFEEINVSNPLFNNIFRKYLLDLLSENITKPWELRELRSTLSIIKEISESYSYSDIIKLQYELTIGIHHWQKTNFGLIVDLRRINISDRRSGKSLSYFEIKNRYGSDVKDSIWHSVQALRKHLMPDGKKYATAMQDKFNLITSLLKEAFDVSGKEKSFKANDGMIKVVFEPLEVVEVDSYDAV